MPTAASGSVLPRVVLLGGPRACLEIVVVDPWAAEIEIPDEQHPSEIHTYKFVAEVRNAAGLFCQYEHTPPVG
jgi:hypothetical protein